MACPDALGKGTGACLLNSGIEHLLLLKWCHFTGL